MATYDAIIIGTGQAGPALARRLVGSGMKVAIIERGRFGGTCVNTGCTPTKTLVASAYAAHVARRGSGYESGRRALVGKIAMEHVSRASEKGRDRRLHENADRCRYKRNPWRVISGNGWRRGDPLRARRHVCEGAVHRY
jgi:pyruvate/2-oxoglutarate dehydrogenase complex dihydrolipoamide dehydrogenase (E3) component